MLVLVRFGLAWSGLVWLGSVWSGLVWSGAVWSGGDCWTSCRAGARPLVHLSEQLLNRRFEGNGLSRQACDVAPEMKTAPAPRALTARQRGHPCEHDGDAGRPGGRVWAAEAGGAMLGSGRAPRSRDARAEP